MRSRNRDRYIIAACAAVGLALGVLVFVVGRRMQAPEPAPIAKQSDTNPTRVWVDARNRSVIAGQAGAGQADFGYPVRSVLNVRKRMRYGDFVWNDKGVAQGSLWVRVDLARQLVSLFRDGHEIGTAVILYGAVNKPTPSGNFTVLQKAEDYHSRTYDAPMPFMLRLTADGVAIHASEVRWGKATHGCIGVPREFARRLYAAMDLGDKVTIIAPQSAAEKSRLTRQ